MIGYLDHGLASEGLVDEVTGATVWHINADEPDLLDYDMTFKQPAQEALYEPNAYRSSDHDPVIIGLDACDEIAPDDRGLGDAGLAVAAEPQVPHGRGDGHGLGRPGTPTPEVELVSATSNEPDNAPGGGDGNTTNDIVVVDDDTFQVRAERDENGSGRVYTITYEATDELREQHDRERDRRRCRSGADRGCSGAGRPGADRITRPAGARIGPTRPGAGCWRRRRPARWWRRRATGRRRPAAAGPRRRDPGACASRGGNSRRTVSRRSAPKRRKETAKQDSSTPWRRASHSTVATVAASKPPAIRTTCGESPGTAADISSPAAASAAASQLATWAAAASARPTSANSTPGGHLHDDRAARGLVEGEQVDARHGLGGHEAQARVAQLGGEGLPAGREQREQLGTVRVDVRDEAARLRGHQRLGRLVDAKHSEILSGRGRLAVLSAR